MNAPSTLEQATLDELLDEIGRRCDAGIVALDLPVQYRGKQVLHRRTFGSLLHCRGILDTSRDLFMAEISRGTDYGPPDAHEGT